MSYKVDKPTAEFIRQGIKFIGDADKSAALMMSSSERLKIAIIQAHLKLLGYDPGPIDGLNGPMTKYAMEQYFAPVKGVPIRDKLPEIKKTDWPNYSELQSFYGNRGENTVLVKCPYKLYLDWDRGKSVKGITIHEKCAPSLTRILAAVHKEYGDEKIAALNLDKFGGSLNVRLMRGSTTKWSTHSWAAAIDWWPSKNQWKWGMDRARLAGPEYDAFWDIWEAEGWVSLGRTRNFDWMHVQAVSLV